MSHRSTPFVNVMNKCISLVKELLNVPKGYSVLFLQGGASLQFLMVPLTDEIKRFSSLFKYRHMVYKSY